MKIHLLLME